MLAEQVVGAWELVSFTAEYPERPGTSTYPLGPDATGIIMYTADGYMSAQIMRPGRQDSDLIEANHDDFDQVAATTGYLAYSGPYTADEATNTLRHKVEVSLLPSWLNTIQIRDATLDGEQLTLAEEDTLPSGKRRSVLVWKRASRGRSATRPG